MLRSKGTAGVSDSPERPHKSARGGCGPRSCCRRKRGQGQNADAGLNRFRRSDVQCRAMSPEDSLRYSDSQPPLATLWGRPVLSNRGIPLNLDWVRQVRVNTSAVERRAQTHVARRTVKKEWQAAWLLRAISCMDLTTLSGDDTDERVRRLCAKARQPIRHDLEKALQLEELGIKVAAGDLLTLRNVARASFVAMMAGADFIKTSTGKETTNATLPVGFVMTRALREYAQETGMAVGFKPAGGIRTAKQSTEWLALMKEELGLSWMKAELFRFGASGLLNDIERQLEFHATGRYSADYRHPIA